MMSLQCRWLLLLKIIFFIFFKAQHNTATQNTFPGLLTAYSLMDRSSDAERFAPNGSHS